MATITELANAIDGYVENRTTARDILIDQIKRATRQVRRKENNLHQDLVREQRRRYDAEAERDNEIIRRQNAEGVEQMAIADLHQLRTNGRNQVNRMLDRIARKQTRIGVLVQERFALQLLYQRNAHHLQRSRADIGLLEYNRDRLYDRYEKWKAKEKNSRQIILALQNNPPLNMADARRLPVLNLIAPGLAKIKPYTGQIPPDEYIDRVIQSWSFAEGHMTALETANAGDFNDAIKCTLLKSKMGENMLQYQQIMVL
jgi:hypothetical protein